MTAKPKRFYFQWRNSSYLRAIVGAWIAGEPITREEVAYLIEVAFGGWLFSSSLRRATGFGLWSEPCEIVRCQLGANFRFLKLRRSAK